MIRLRRTGSLKGNQQTEGFQKQQICRWNFIFPLFWSREMTNSEVLQVKLLHMWNPQLIAYKSTVFTAIFSTWRLPGQKLINDKGKSTINLFRIIYWKGDCERTFKCNWTLPFWSGRFKLRINIEILSMVFTKK